MIEILAGIVLSSVYFGTGMYAADRVLPARGGTRLQRVSWYVAWFNVTTLWPILFGIAYVVFQVNRRRQR